MGWNDRLDKEPITCDDCGDCEEECTFHEEPCSDCGFYPCVCDLLYESSLEDFAEMNKEN